jgi:hypothetical protein
MFLLPNHNTCPLYLRFLSNKVHHIVFVVYFMHFVMFFLSIFSIVATHLVNCLILLSFSFFPMAKCVMYFYKSNTTCRPILYLKLFSTKVHHVVLATIVSFPFQP